jgi:hypothetical protein
MTELAAEFHLAWSARVTFACYVLFTVAAHGDDATELRKVVVYGMFSAGTTLLFWVIRLSARWQTTAAEHAGSVIGLSLRNCIEYQVDKNYVFGRMA